MHNYAPGHGNNGLVRMNVMYKHYLNDKMELMGKLSSNDATNSDMNISASK